MRRTGAGATAASLRLADTNSKTTSSLDQRLFGLTTDMRGTMAKDENAEGARASGARRPAGQVQSLTRALNLLRAISDHDGGSLSELVARTGLPPSTAHRLLTTLESERFVQYDSANGLWRIGLSAFLVGVGFQRTRDVLRVAKPFLKRLMEQSGETANMYLVDDGELVCASQVESRQMMRAITRVGGRPPLYCSGAGKAYLSRLSSDEFSNAVNLSNLKALTERTITTPQRLMAEMEEVRKAGFAIDDEEQVLGVRCVAAAVVDEKGAPVAAISVSGPVTRMDKGRLHKLGSLIQSAAEEITRDFGGRYDRA